MWLICAISLVKVIQMVVSRHINCSLERRLLLFKRIRIQTALVFHLLNKITVPGFVKIVKLIQFV